MIASRRVLHSSLFFAAAVTALVATSPASAQTPGKTLAACQSAVRKEAASHVAARAKAVEGCLQRVARDVVGKENGNLAKAAKACAKGFDKLLGGGDPAKSAAATLAARVSAKCEPGQKGVTHTLADLLGAGSEIEPLHASRLSTACARHGGDGELDSLEDWIDCLVAAQSCATDALTALRFPRAIEWLGAVALEMEQAGLLAAAEAVTAVASSIDGEPVDGQPDLHCGAALCGNGVAETGEGCDGDDLRSRTCEDFGLGGGQLGCASCELDVHPCERRVFLTVETTSGDLGGLEGADAFCAASAAAASLPGTYLAWLSDGVHSPDTRFVKGTGRYILPNGVVVADDWADLTDGSIQQAINRGANGQSVGDFGFVWTNVTASGETHSTEHHCEGWTSGLASSTTFHTGVAPQGTVSMGPTWTAGPVETACDSTPFRIYCFEQ